MPIDDSKDYAGAIPPSEAPTLLCQYAVTAGCSDENIKVCPICHHPFCQEHASRHDPECCSGCLIHEGTLMTHEPLIDDDGITHKGQVIKPVGFAFRTMITRIAEFDDDQLEAHIEYMKKQVKDAEMVLAYRRIDLAASTVEFEQRGVAKKRNLRRQGMDMIANGRLKVGGPTEAKNPAKQKAVQSLVDKMKMIAASLGIKVETPEELAKFATLLKAMRGAAQPAAQEKK